MIRAQTPRDVYRNLSIVTTGKPGPVHVRDQRGHYRGTVSAGRFVAPPGSDRDMYRRAVAIALFDGDKPDKEGRILMLATCHRIRAGLAS